MKDVDFGHELDAPLPIDAQDQEEALGILNMYIQGLGYLNDENKSWAYQDARQRIFAGADPTELRDKYDLYNQLGEIRAEIIQNVPTGKREILHKFIDEQIINPSSGNGRNREIKREQLQQVHATVQLFRHQQNNLQSFVRRTLATSDVDFRVLHILDKKLFVDAEKIFNDDFWQKASKLSPQLFPAFTEAFEFSVRRTFSLEKSSDHLKAFSKKIKKGILQDAERLCSQFFTSQEVRQKKTDLKALSSDNPALLVSALAQLHEEQISRQNQAQKQFEHIQALYLSGSLKTAQSELKSLQNHFGNSVLSDLNQMHFSIKLSLQIRTIEQLEQKLKATKNPDQQKKLKAKLEYLQQGDFKNNILHNAATDPQQQSLQLLEEIQEFRRQGDLKSAKSSAERLVQYNVFRAQRELDSIHKDMERKQESDKQRDVSLDNKAENSLEKATKVMFLEGCIEHAEKVKEMCERLGIPKDDPKFWGDEGVKNRVKWLEEKGFYKTYKKFNASDTNMPKQERVQGVRFRWLDVQRGSNLTFSRAHEGLKYLTRYKESGYELATLAGGFSLDWNTNGPNSRTPDKFILLATEELMKLKNVSATKKLPMAA